MATILDGVIDRQRRADIAANAVALGECSRMAHNITRTSLARVGGAHLSEAPNAARFSEEDLLAADLERSTNKAEKAHARNDAAALDLQVQFMREHGAL
jgi:hypothetical protein